MADNPIKHDDLIQPGNPFDKATKGLTEMIKLYDKLLKDIKKSAKDQVEAINKLNTATKQGRAETKKSATAVQKLSEQEKAALSIKKALEREQAKLTAMNTKEYRELMKAKEATRLRNVELKKTVREQELGVKSTNKWSKALGSFQFKFNALGNVAALALQRIASGIVNSIKKFTSLEKIVRSNQITSDSFDRTMGRLKESFRAFNESVALGDFSNLASNIKAAADAAEEYVRAMDTLGDTQNAIDIQTAKARLEVGKLQEIYNNTAEDNQKRLEAAQEAATILSKLQVEQERVAKSYWDEEMKRIQNRFQLTDEQLDVYKRFIENYNLLTDSQVTELEKLETAQVNASKETDRGSRIMNALAQSSTGGAYAIEQSTEAQEEYFKMAKEISNTLGFDVLPIMNTIVKTNDEDRKAVVEKTVAYYDQLRATQKLTNANAAMTGSILNKMKSDKTSNDEIERTIGLLPEINKVTDNINEDGIEFPELDWNIDYPEKEKKDKEFLNKRAQDWHASQQKMTEAEKEQAAERDKIISQSFAMASNIVSSFTSLYANQKAKELSMVGDNAKKREAIEKKYAKKEQRLAIISAIISTAQGVAGALGDFPFPYSLIPAAIVGAMGAAEIATISGQEFAEGGSGLLGDKGGVLPGKRHSQGGVDLGEVGEAERGEYFGIVNRQMTRKYAGDLPSIFESLNNGAFHDVWGRSPRPGDPYTKKMYELMQNTPVIVPEGRRVEKYPNGRTRIVNV